MDKNQVKILVLVEGAKTDVKLMKHLLDLYGINKNHQIVSYNTNIYTLYDKIFDKYDPDDIDLLQLLKENEKDEEKKAIFDAYYSDILLVFDLDPQDPLFTPEKIIWMAEYFVESSDMGKLYLNFPMVEAFYHMKSIPDNDYNSYTATLQQLRDKKYKKRVNSENRNHDYSKFAATRDECNIVIGQNIEKARELTYNHNIAVPKLNEILQKQLKMLKENDCISVLCTCVFYIYDYNPKLLKS